MVLKLYQTGPKPASKGSPGFNSWPNRAGTPIDPWINIMALSDIRIPEANGNPQLRFLDRSLHDDTTGLITAIPTGYNSIQYGFDFKAFAAGHPSFGKYVMRYSGLTPAYNFTFTNNFITNISGNIVIDSTGAGEIRFDVNAAANWNVKLSGPAGDLPTGYEIRILRESDVDGFYNASVPATHATRLFKPETLALMQSWEMSEIRMMDVQDINNDYNVRTQNYTFPPTACFFGRHVGIEALVSLCNHLGSDLYYCFHLKATPAFKIYVCEYIRDHLDITLGVKFENANEMWNNGFRQIAAGRHEGIVTLGQRATGTVSVAKGVKLLTSTDMDLTTVFGPSPLAKEVAILGASRSYTVDRNNVAASSVALLGSVSPLETLTDAAFYTPKTQGLEDNIGNLRLATQSMQVVDAIFKPAGQLNRVTKILGGKLNDGNRTNSLLYPSALYNRSDYQDPKRLFDAVAFNPYFGSGALNVEFLTELQTLYASNDTEGWRNLYTECLMGRHPTISVGNSLVGQENACRTQWQNCKSAGLQMVCYEGGPHLIQDAQVDSEDDYILNSYADWLSSPQAREVFERWTDWFIKYFDGPINKFTFMGKDTTHFGHWSTVTQYSDGLEKDELVKALADFIGRDPWWDPAFPPQKPKWVDPIVLFSGTEQMINLNHYISNNVRSFSAASVPVGMSLWHTGVLTGTPLSGPAMDHVFTCSNDAGSVDVTLSIEVI